MAWLLFRWRKQGRADIFVMGAYLVLAATIRFLIEFIRVDVRVLGVLSVAHLASLMAIALGVAFLLRRNEGIGAGTSWWNHVKAASSRSTPG